MNKAAKTLIMRVGHGYDVHKLIDATEYQATYPQRSLPNGLILCGEEIEHHLFLAGHSDADVAIHALIDAILGALAEADIGTHFPDNDPEYAGISSLKFLAKVKELIEQKEYRVANLDLTIVAEKPKLRPYIDKMRANLANELGIELDQVSVKATTAEGLGFVGHEQGIAAYASILLLTS